MTNLEIPINTTIELVEDIASLDLDCMMIPSGTLGKIEAHERNPHTGEIMGYYATIYGVYEEFLYLDLWEFEVVDERVDRFVEFDFDKDTLILNSGTLLSWQFCDSYA